ncbi:MULTISPECIES: PspC domain-containing protein [Aerococcus]|uniref:PspC domain-containing protein n=1 Tax=Aerococcus sanguinicola TaxID=119206 RepID=A0A5N1GN99_9LACT|nr:MULTISPECIES: PspC domain-containing protein [Aerococcus]KAA9302272.1 PspC domain-containing protein [Aerococcus sanguinicola]MDK6369026.1 PspC domain-containing protein [Aerococcus sp. UMB9870]MDK6678928.1 PspC domain-containing protein [Aerococcus sp. UMB8608]MDK6686519.1 PspC domain-containing protein [Aerococcus sp. UMB8623]MDK6939587.1 PspC domain-containing protein [Aerococcus sp. UMB8487]
MTKKLRRSKTDRVLTGLLGGLAAYFAVSSTVIRWLYTIFTFFNPFLILIYIVAAYLIPSEGNSFKRKHEKTHRHPRGFGRIKEAEHIDDDKQGTWNDF